MTSTDINHPKHQPTLNEVNQNIPMNFIHAVNPLPHDVRVALSTGFIPHFWSLGTLFTMWNWSNTIKNILKTPKKIEETIKRPLETTSKSLKNPGKTW